jgi:transposase
MNLEAIFYVLRTGCSWRDVPDMYGKWYTVYMRYVRWMESGVFGRILLAIQKIKPMKLQIVCLDSRSVKVHPSAS